MPFKVNCAYLINLLSRMYVSADVMCMVQNDKYYCFCSLHKFSTNLTKSYNKLHLYVVLQCAHMQASGQNQLVTDEQFQNICITVLVSKILRFVITKK